MARLNNWNLKTIEIEPFALIMSVIIYDSLRSGFKFYPVYIPRYTIGTLAEIKLLKIAREINVSARKQKTRYI